MRLLIPIIPVSEVLTLGNLEHLMNFSLLLKYYFSKLQVRNLKIFSTWRWTSLLTLPMLIHSLLLCCCGQIGHMYVTPYTLILANYLIMIVILVYMQVYPDRACKRTVLSLTVKCHNSGNECDWTGELHNLPVSICFHF